MDSFSSRLADCLKKAEMKNVHLAREIGVGSSAVGKWLKGELTPKSDQLLKLALYFDVPMEWLLTGEQGRLRPSTRAAGLAVEKELQAMSPAEVQAERDEEFKRMAHNANVAMNQVHDLKEENRELRKKLELARKTFDVMSRQLGFGEKEA